MRPTIADVTARGEVQLLLTAAAKTRHAVLFDVLQSAIGVPALAPTDAEARDALVTLFEPLSDEEPSIVPEYQVPRQSPSPQ